MCISNILCEATDGSCQCSNLLKGSAFVPVAPVPLALVAAPTAFLQIYHQICEQNQQMLSFKDELNRFLERLSSLEQPIAKEVSSNFDEDSVVTSAKLLKHLCGETVHRYTLEPVSGIINPVYKDRTFSIQLQIMDANKNIVELQKSIFCKIMLYSTENPPKIMKLNTNGNPILRGNIDLHGNSYFFFRKIAIKEVSSHFRNGCCFLVVMPSNKTEIAPFILEDFVVKARKINGEVSQRKKAKFDQDSNSTE